MVDVILRSFALSVADGWWSGVYPSLILFVSSLAPCPLRTVVAYVGPYLLPFVGDLLALLLVPTIPVLVQVLLRLLLLRQASPD